MSELADTTCPDARSQVRMAGFLLACLGVAFVGLLFRLVYIDTALAPRLQAIAEQQQETLSMIPARRGSILDTRGRVLAVSQMRYSVFADPELVEQKDETARVLSHVLEMSAGEIENEMWASGSPRFCWLQRRVDEVTADAVRGLKLTGIGLHPEFERDWPMHETACQVIGIVGSDGKGLEGVELAYNAHLSGTPGERNVRRDARRHALGAGADGLAPPVDGGHVLLTIDSVIQTIVEERLADQVQQFEAESGVAVVMSPKTGEVLALANVPTFDVNRYNDFDASLRRDRAITDPVEPGSIFKPVVMAGALDGGFVHVTEQIDCHNGMFSFGGRIIHDTHPKSILDPRGIIVHSSNIGMGIIGERMGNKVLRETLSKFGLGALTQVGLPGESEGIVPPLKQWNRYSTTSVPMGHEVAVTPLQLAAAFSAVVNHGVLLRPRIVRAKLGADYAPVEEFDEPEMIQRVMAPEVADYIRREMLTGVVEEGGEPLDASPYAMCGKTGTAQVPYTNRRGYEPNAYLSSFVGAAPVDDPEIVVLVMIRKPNRAIGYYGRVVSGPVVRDVVRSVLAYLEVAPPAQLATSR
ncbi:MAG: penicillin-binding protein 2 [Phycisphaerales bacterium]|nr:penicillin-binding protein 2 [Phycisphaerales bacterium]